MQCAQCTKCKTFLTYIGAASGTSHLGRHSCAAPTQAQLSITSMMKVTKCPTSVTSRLADKAAIMCGKDLRPFNMLAGEGFKQYGQELINIGAKYGSVNISDVSPDPTTVSRHVHDMAEDVRKEVIPEVVEAINSHQCGATTDMWDDKHTKTDYTSVTVHYINQKWELLKRLMFTAAFNGDQRKTGDNIRKQIVKHLVGLGVDKNSAKTIVWVSDRGSNVIKALNEWQRYSITQYYLKYPV